MLFSFRVQFDHAKPPRRHHACGITLVEVMIVVLIMGIVASSLITSFGANSPDSLKAAAQILAADLDYARSLAVSNSSTYQIEFRNDAYVLSHSGSNSALNNLPENAFRRPGDDRTTLVVAFDELPSLGNSISIVAAVTDDPSPEIVSKVEFGSFGQTTETQPTLVWLSTAGGTSQLYLPIHIHPITGMAELGEISATPPAIPADSGGEDV